MINRSVALDIASRSSSLSHPPTLKSGAADARQIVDEAQRRNASTSQRYEGLLQVLDAKGTDQRQALDVRTSRVARPQQGGVEIHRTGRSEGRRAADRQPSRIARRINGCGRRPSNATAGLRCRTVPRDSSEPTSASRISKSATSINTPTLSTARTRSTARRAGRSARHPRNRNPLSTPRSTVWIRKDNYAWARIENYTKAGIARRLQYSDIRNVQGIWTAHQLEMHDLVRGSRTRLTLDKLQYNATLQDQDFTVPALRRQ